LTGKVSNPHKQLGVGLQLFVLEKLSLIKKGGGDCSSAYISAARPTTSTVQQKLQNNQQHIMKAIAFKA
jgi:hypothetical protein